VCEWPSLPGRDCLLTMGAGGLHILSDTGDTVAVLPAQVPFDTDYRGAGFQARDGTWAFAVTSTAATLHTSIVSVYALDGRLLCKTTHPDGQISGPLRLPLSRGGGFAYAVGEVIRRVTWDGPAR
jgi:hypothetical protein